MATTQPRLRVVARQSIGPKQLDITVPNPIGPSSSINTIVELPVPVALSLYTGDSFRMTLTLTNVDGTPTDLSGAQVKSQIRPTAPDSTISAEFHVGIQANVITLELHGGESQNLVGNFVWDCQVTYSDGWVQTPVAGPVVFTQDVTRP